MSPPRILFIANAGPDVGGGHVMRSLTLARTFIERGADVRFLASPEAQRVLDVFGRDIQTVPVASPAPAHLVAAAQRQAFEAVVFDHYDLGRAEHQAIAGDRPSLVIDDLANRPLGGDLVLDPGPARDPRDYVGLIGKTRLLLGPAYAPVRSRFASLRETALKRRSDPVRRILVALGLTDVGGFTARVVRQLQRFDGDLVFCVVVGGGSAAVPQLRDLARQDARIELHVDARDMAELTAAADIAIGAAGSTTWERCILGLPSVIVVLADNQRPAAEALRAREAALVLDVADAGFDAGLEAAVHLLISDDALRHRISASSAALCDGLGAGRVADAFFALIAESRT